MARRLPPAEVRFTAKDETRRGVASVERSIGGLQKKFKGLGASLGLAAAGLGFQRLISSQLKVLDAIGKSSKQFNIATESVSSLQFAAEQSGLTFETFSTAMRTGAKNVGEASQGFGMAREEIQELGLSAAELRKQPIDEQFRTIVSSLAAVQNQGDKTRIAMAIFGRSGSEILKVQDSLSELEAQAVSLGITFDKETIAAAEDVNDAMNRMKKVSFATAVNFTANFLPAIEATANYMVEAMPKVGRITGAAFTLIYSTALLAQAGFKMVERAMVDTAEEPIRRWEAIPGIVKRALLSVVPIPGLGRVLSEAKFDQGLQDPIDKSAELSESIDGIFQKLAELRGDLIPDSVAAAIPTLTEINNNLDGTDKGLQRINVRARKLPQYLTTWQKASEKAGKGMMRNMEEFFYNPAEEGIKGFAKSMINTLRRIAAEIASQKIFKAIFGKLSLGTPSPLSLEQMSFGALSNPSLNTLSLSGPSPTLTSTMKLAGGGRPRVGDVAMVGERGPELWIADKPGRIIPNHHLKRTDTAGGGFTQVNNFNISAGTDPKIMQQLPAILEENRRRTIAELSQQKGRSRF